MPEDEAKYHMKRCIDSGLWLPEGGKANAAADAADEAAAAATADAKGNESDGAKATSSTNSKPSISTEDVD